MAKKSELVTLVNTGLCVIYIGRDRIMPGESIDVEAEALETEAMEYFISRGEFTVKDNSALTEEVKTRANSKRKKDPTEGKSQAELEDGGEF